MGTPQSRGRRTRQVILNAAYRLFIQQGFHGTSMRQIASRSKTALSGIYNHFDSKQAIFRELILERHIYHQVLPILLSTPSDDPEVFFRTAARTVLSELGKHPDFMKLMLIEMVEFNGRNTPAVIDRALPQAMPLISKIARYKAGRSRPPVAVFRAFIGLLFGYHLTELMNTGAARALAGENSLDDFVELFLYGALPRTERT